MAVSLVKMVTITAVTRVGGPVRTITIPASLLPVRER